MKSQADFNPLDARGVSIMLCELVRLIQTINSYICSYDNDIIQLNWDSKILSAAQCSNNSFKKHADC